MYQLLLTSTVEDPDLDAACSILAGVCGMPPWKTVQRVLSFQGPPRPSGISNQSSIDRTDRSAVALWKDLHQKLARQSYTLQVRYDVLPERDFGTAVPFDLDATPGILRWTDFPDPPQSHSRPMLTQRKTVELWNQKNLPSVMRDNHHTFKTETVEEIYRFFRDDVEFSLVRHYLMRPIQDYMPLGQRTPSPAGALPEWGKLVPVDQQRRWILQIKTHAMQDDNPEELRKAQDALMKIRDELDGVFEFRSVDRKFHDTRVAQVAQGIQALPQKITIGMRG